MGDLPVGHVRQAGQHVPKIGIGIDAPASATLDEGVKDGAALTGLSLADEEPVLFSERRRADGVLDQVIVDLQTPVGDILPQLRPLPEHLVDGFAHGTLGKSLDAVLIEPGFDVCENWQCLLLGVTHIFRR